MFDHLQDSEAFYNTLWIYIVFKNSLILLDDFGNVQIWLENGQLLFLNVSMCSAVIMCACMRVEKDGCTAKVLYAMTMRMPSCVDENSN